MNKIDCSEKTKYEIYGEEKRNLISISSRTILLVCNKEIIWSLITQITYPDNSFIKISVIFQKQGWMSSKKKKERILTK